MYSHPTDCPRAIRLGVRQAAIVTSMAAVLFALSTGCSRATPFQAQDALQAWPQHEQRTRARQIYADYGVVLAHDDAWTAADIDAFEAGLAALPGSFYDPDAAPMLVRRVDETCPRGIGDDSDGCPRFDDDGRTFFVYDLDSRTESEDLWRRRAAVHMMTSVLDRRRGWSDLPAWQSINAWDGDRALNMAAAGYARPLGQASSHLDLVTFAESFFVEEPGVANPNQHIRCREFTRSFFVIEHVLGRDSAVDDDGSMDWLPEQGCPAFEKWARLDQLDTVELLLATATADRPESLYGHLLLHLRYSPDDSVDAHGFDPVYQFGAVTDTEIESLMYVFKGIFGGFPSVLTAHTFREIERMIMLREGRSLSRFELVLTPTQQVRLLHRLREVQRRDKLDYKFFKRNCASFLIYALSPVFDGRMDPRMTGIFAMPTDVLDVLADTTYEGESILKKSGADYRSHRRRTRRAARERRAALAGLIEAARLPEERAESLMRIDRKLDADEPEQRTAAYRELQDEFVDTLTQWKLGSGEPAGSEDVETMMVDYLYMVSTSERYFSQVMYMRERIRAEEYAALEYPLTAEEQLERRETLQSIEDHEKRQRLINKWAAEQARRIEKARTAVRATKDPETLRAEQSQRAAYLEALELQATLMRLFSSDFDAVTHLRERDEQRDRLAAETAARALPDSGRNRIYLRGNIEPAAGLTDTIRAGFTYALISDRLGEVRQRGFRANLESEALVVSADIDTSMPLERAFSGEFKLFRYRDLTREPRLLRDSFVDALGWGADVRIYHDGPRGQLFGGRANVGYIAPIVSDPAHSSLLAFGIYPELNAYLGSGQQMLFGGRAALRAQLHLFGAYANVIRLRAESAHYLGLDTLAWHQESAAHLAVDFAVPVGSSQPMIVSPFGRAEWHMLTTDDRAEPVIRAGLEVELPW